MDKDIFNVIIAPLVRIKQPWSNSYDSNPKIIPIHPAKACDDCGLKIRGRTVEYVVKGLNTDNPYWTKKCSECGERFGEISRKDII